MRNAGILQSAITANLPLELDYRQPRISMELNETSGHMPPQRDYAMPGVRDEFEQLLSAI